MEYLVIYNDKTWEWFSLCEMRVERGKHILFIGKMRGTSIKKHDVLFILEFKNSVFQHIYNPEELLRGE